MQKLVITTKSVEYMPFFLSLASLGNGLAWTTYALIHFDPFIVVIALSLLLMFFFRYIQISMADFRLLRSIKFVNILLY